MEQTNALLKKQLRLYRFIALLLVLVVLSTGITSAILVRNMQQIQTTVVKIDAIVDDLAITTGELSKVNWNEMTAELEVITKELSTVNWNGLSKDIGDMATQAQESLATASKAVDELDIETLNKAIQELQTVVEPLAKLVGNEPESLHKPNLIPIFFGIALGIALGTLPIRFPSMPQPLKLGLAGGPLIVARINSPPCCIS